MPFNDRPLIENRSPSQAPGDGLGGLIASPDLNSKADPRQHAIRDIGQAREVVRTLQAAGKYRSVVNARIQGKINSESPYDQHKLEAEGLGWRSNASFRVLSTLIDKIWPRFVQAVQGLKYITNSSLPDKYANSTEKTETFRKVVTDTIRERKGWTELLESIAFTNCVFGHAIVAWLDEHTWFPVAFDQAESFVTDGCKQLPKYAQVVVLRESKMPHELFQQIKDREEAKTAGWNIENAIKAINNASPAQLRDMLGNGGTTESWYQNAWRELTLGSSYIGGASVIAIYHLLVTEVNGKVSHYKLAGESLDEIFSRDDRFDSPDDALAFFSYERGNGTLHGSKGIGRSAYTLAGLIERSRNEFLDRSILSGKLIITGDPKRLHTYKMSVVGMTCIMPAGWTISSERIESDIEGFLRLDAYFSQLADGIVGNVSPPQIGGQGEAFRSSASWQLLAAREEEGKDSRILRFLQQFVSFVQTMQRRICSKDCIEEDAKRAYKELKAAGLSPEEIKVLAESPVAGTVADLTPMERQMVVALAQEKKGNPLFNQRALEVEDVTARLGTAFAERVILPVDDPTEEAEQSRQQLLEITLLAMGQPVPVSPRDSDLLHLETLMPAAEQLAGQILQGGSETAGLSAMLEHVTAHVNAAQAKGEDKNDPILQAAMEFAKNGASVIAQLKELDQQAQQLQQADAGEQQDQPPQPQPQQITQ